MMETKKYELTEETKVLEDKTVLHRIKALKDFNSIEAGDLGGWVERESNLSQNGDCWIYRNAMVYGDARVSENARIYDDARVSGNARVSGYARIKENACVREKACVGEYANVSGRTKIYGNATVSGEAMVSENAVICQLQRVINGGCYSDLSTNLKESIRCQTGLGVLNNKVIAYKQVNKDLTSFHDWDFQYKIGEYAIVEDYEDSNKSCASGLHFSNMNYWNKSANPLYNTFLIAEINLDDIITVQDGKIRCKKALILGKYEIED